MEYSKDDLISDFGEISSIYGLYDRHGYSEVQDLAEWATNLPQSLQAGALLAAVKLIAERLDSAKSELAIRLTYYIKDNIPDGLDFEDRLKLL